MREAPEPYEESSFDFLQPRRRRLLFAAVGGAAIIVISIIAVLISSGNQEVGTSGFTAKSCTATSAQAQFQCTVIQDRSALIPGSVAASRKITVPLDQADQFEVTVCGDRSAECRDAAPASKPSYALRSTGGPQVLVGGYISAKLTSSMPGQIEPESEQVQPVITDADAATWIWEIEPTQAGTFALTLTVTPLLGDTDTALVAGVPYAIRLTVTESASQHLSHAADSGSALVLHVGEILGALGATAAGIGTWFVQRVRKRRKAGAKPSEKEPAVTDSDSAAGPPPVPADPAPLRHRRPPQPRG